MEGVTVIHQMADGTICTDLSKYLDTHELPETTVRILRQMLLGKK